MALGNPKNQLVWRGETVNGKYLGEVALLTDLSPVVHCESFVDGHWRLWSYVNDSEQVIQDGKAASLEEAKYVCEQTALAIQGLHNLQSAPMQQPMQPMHPMQPMLQMPVFMPNMTAPQASYEEVDPSPSLQELRFKFRRWAISLTLIGGVFLSIWYSMLLKPVSTISLLVVLTSIIWGAQALIKSFRRPQQTVSVDSPESLAPTLTPTVLATPRFKPARFRPASAQQVAFVQAVPQLPQLPVASASHPALQQAAQANLYNQAYNQTYNQAIPAIHMQQSHYRSNG